MIPKNKTCLSCGRDDQPHFARKLCKFCAMKEYSKKKKPKTSASKQSAKKSENKILRDAYFDHHTPLCTHSEESGEPIYNAWRGNVCHLVCKGRHPSVQDNLDNYIYLTLQEHSILDNRLFKNEFEKLEVELPTAWKIYCERVIKVLPFVTERTKFIKKLSEYLKI